MYPRHPPATTQFHAKYRNPHAIPTTFSFGRAREPFVLSERISLLQDPSRIDAPARVRYNTRPSVR